MNKKIQELTEIILNRDESMFRVFAIDLAKNSSPSQFRNIIVKALDRAGDIEMKRTGSIEKSFEPSLWLEKVGTIQSPKERKESLKNKKQEIFKELINAGYEESIDFELTTNGSFRLLTQEVIEALRDCCSQNQWEWLIHSKIVRIPSTPSTT
jgi:hypothetical protein